LKILIDENLPLKLAAALREVGHEADSVHALHLLGIENGALYRLACEEYDLCFTRDHGFAHNVQQGDTPQRLRLIQVTLPQKPQDEFVADFIAAFSDADWETIPHGSRWP
jgi:predicted nuclease of predicted toxin-antitoxin system